MNLAQLAQESAELAAAVAEEMNSRAKADLSNVTSDTFGAKTFTATGASAGRGVAARFGDALNVKDFGAVGDGSADDTAAFSAALTAVRAQGGGRLLVPAGDYKISSTLSLQQVLLEGAGQGRVASPAVSPATHLLWYGAAGGTMLQLGNTGAMTLGGGLRHMRVDGRAVAARCLLSKDHQYGLIEHVELTGATSDAWEMTNTAGLTNPTGRYQVTDLLVFLRGGSTNSASGIFLNGTGTGVEGVTLCRFNGVGITHANGHGIKLGERADGMEWLNLHTFRADTVETGYGVYVGATGDGRIVSGHTFDGHTIITGGIYVAKVLSAFGWTITMLNDVDVNSDLADLVSGPGASEVSVLTSYSTRMNGPARYSGAGHREAAWQDTMSFRRWDSTNNLLHTGQHTYLTGGDYATAAMADAGVSGSATAISTGTTNGNALYIADAPALGTTGVLTTYKPMLAAAWTPASGSTANIKARVGLLADVTDSPTNGIYVEADPATSAFYRCVCRAAGVETAVASAVGVAAARVQWRIEVDEAVVRFLYRTAGNNGWGLAAETTTNIPANTILLSPVAWVKTTTGAARTIHLYDLRFVHRVEL